MFSKKSLAIVNVLIFIVVFTILAGVLLTLYSSNTLFMEASIRRTKAYYAAEAGSVHALDQMRHNVDPFDPSIEWIYDAAGNSVLNKTAVISNTSFTGPYGASIINSTFDYTFNW